MQTFLLVVLGIIVFGIVAIAALAAYFGVKVARVAKPALKKEIAKASALVNHPVVGEDARDALKRAGELTEQIPNAGLFNLKTTYKAIAEATKALMEAVEKAHEYRRKHTQSEITGAERHVEITAESIRREFSKEADMAVAQSLLGDASKLVSEKKYDEAEAKAKLAIDAANAEYARARSGSGGTPESGPVS